MFKSYTTGGYPVNYGGKTYGQSNPDYEGIIAGIVQEVEDLTRKGIQEWRQAIDAANDTEEPRWHLLQDLYETLSTDGHLVSQVNIRKAAVLSKRFVIRDSKTGKEDKEKTRLVQKQWFMSLISDLLDSIFRGYTVAQIPDARRIPFLGPLEDKYFMLPRRNFIPQKNLILKETMGNEGYLVTDKAFKNTIICIKDTSRYGVMNAIIPDLIWKRNARQGWAIFSERFGIPLVKIETNRTQKKDIDALEAMAKKMGQAARAVVPTGSKLEVIDSATKGDPYKIYLEQVNLGNEEISKAILGGTMISDNGASRSQSEVMERTLDGKITEMDLTRMEFCLNDQVLPILRAGGWPFDENDEVAYDRSEALNATEHWNIVNGMLSRGYEVDEQWLNEKFNVPIIGKKETKPDKQQNPDGNFNQPPADKKPEASGGVAFPVYTSSGCCPDCGKIRAEGHDRAFLEFLDKLEEDIMNGIWDGKDALPDRVRKGIAVGNEYRDGLFSGWAPRRIEIDYGATDHHALAAMEMNLFTFSQLREQASVLELNKLLIDKEGKRIRSFDEFKELAKPHLQNMNRGWLETEYNFAVATGQGASRYHQFLSEADTITHYLEYMTVGDKRVRPKHAQLQGRKFSIYDPEARKIWPPNDWGCRCEFLQYLGDVSKETLTTGAKGQELLEWTDKQKAIFGVNRGEVGQVFLNNQYYIADTGLAADVKSMTYDKYGLRPWAEIRQDSPALNLDKSITTDNVHELFRPEEGKDYMGFKDHLNRALTLSKKVFEEHTQKPLYTTEVENRHQLFPKVKDVLSSPDEVYMHSYKDGVYQLRYVKHYNEAMMVVPVRLGKQNLEISTWYQLKGKEKAQRVGLLIHQNKKP